MASPAIRATNTAYVGSTSQATILINNPSSTVGDLLLASVIYGGTVTPPPGQGWTSIGTNTDGAVEMQLFYRFVGGSDPTSFTFTLGASATYVTGAIIAISGADPTTPVESYNMAGAAGTSQTTGSLTPTRIGCLPIAAFSIHQPNSGSPNVSGKASGWSELAVVTYPNTVYNASEYQAGPVTVDTTTAITATGNWDSFSTGPGVVAILLIQPGVPSAITINGSATPAAITLATTGATSTITIAQTGSSTPITVTSSDTSKVTLSKSSVNPPSDTVVATAVAPGTVTITATGA